MSTDTTRTGGKSEDSLLLCSVRAVVDAIAPPLLVLLELVLADGTVEGAIEPIMLPQAAQRAVLATEVTSV